MNWSVLIYVHRRLNVPQFALDVGRDEIEGLVHKMETKRGEWTQMVVYHKREIRRVYTYGRDRCRCDECQHD
jgi:hypothetical protein